MKKIKKIFALLLVAMMILVMAGCSSPSTKENVEQPVNNNAGETGTKTKDSLVVALTADLQTLDPANHVQVMSSLVTESIYDTLFIPDQDGNPVPQIAESYKYITDTELQIKIHEGIKFHDGSEMKAEDVQFSLMRAKDSKVVGSYYEQVKSIDIIDDYTIQINLEAPYIPFLVALAHHSAAIMPKAYLESDPDFTAPIGSGAYKFVSWTSGDSIVLEKNEDYFDESHMSPFNELIFRVIPEGTSRTIALEAGEVDLVVELETIDYDRISNTSGLQTYLRDINGTNYLFFNVEKAPYDNVKFRKAFNYAVNKEAVNIVATNGLSTLMHSITASHFLGYNEEVRYDYDPVKAKELFAEAGVTSDTVLTITVNGDVKKRIAEVIQGNLADVGVKAEIEVVDWGKYIEVTGNGDYEIAILSWNQASDPDRYFSMLLHSNAINGQNRARYSNTELDKLIDAGRIESDPVKRESIYHEAYRVAMDDAPWVPLYIMSRVMGSTDDLELDKAVSAEGSIYFNFIEIK